MEERIIRLNHISKKFSEKVICNDVNLSFGEGVYIICGENGCGKSTLLKMMMGLILPDKGDVFLFGENTVHMSLEAKSKIGVVFSSDRSLYYKLTAFENLMYTGRIYGVSKKELKQRIPELLSLVQLENNSKYIETYSTGMKKRLMIARSLINNPDIIFFDEVFNGLDKDGCIMVLKVIEDLRKKNKCIFIVTHQMEYIPPYSRVLKLHDGELYVLDC